MAGTTSATIIAKVGRRQISGPSATSLGFNEINHCHGESWQTPNLITISAQVGIYNISLHHGASWWAQSVRTLIDQDLNSIKSTTIMAKVC